MGAGGVGLSAARGAPGRAGTGSGSGVCSGAVCGCSAGLSSETHNLSTPISVCSCPIAAAWASVFGVAAGAAHQPRPKATISSTATTASAFSALRLPGVFPDKDGFPHALPGFAETGVPSAGLLMWVWWWLSWSVVRFDVDAADVEAHGEGRGVVRAPELVAKQRGCCWGVGSGDEPRGLERGVQATHMPVHAARRG